MNFIVSDSDLALLLEFAKDKELVDALRSAKEYNRSGTAENTRIKRFIVAVDKNQREAIVDLLSSLFAEQGITKDTSEPNSLGYRIEALIDIFNPYIDNA